MGFKQKIKNVPWLYNLLLALLNALNYFTIRFNYTFPRYRLTPYWKARIRKVLDSPDNERMEHVTGAGKLFKDHQLMHNGIKITLGSYYDYGNTHLLIENRGVHEPQEEYAFQEILKWIPEGGSMMELGSYWAFYSMWFAKAVKGAQCMMVEPDPHKMNFGKLNFNLNKLQGNFCLGFIDGTTNKSKHIPTYHVDHLMKKWDVHHLNILHSDIQGYELKMLKGAAESLRSKKISFLFISTHSNDLHQACIRELESHGYLILADANLDESYAVDGVIIAKSPLAPGPEKISIHKATPNEAMLS